MIITVLKTTFKKATPKVITYRSYKTFDNHASRGNLRHDVVSWVNYTELEKKKIVRANEVPYMTKDCSC